MLFDQVKDFGFLRGEGTWQQKLIDRTPHYKYPFWQSEFSGPHKVFGTIIKLVEELMLQNFWKLIIKIPVGN